MAEDEAPETNCNIPEPPQLSSLPAPFVEVMCKSSGKTRRFAAGTEAGFALSLINKKLDCGMPLAWLIESVKEGEEPVSFGPKSVLVDYGNGWKLKTVTEFEGTGRGEGVQPTKMPMPTAMGPDGLRPVQKASQPIINFMYIGRIILAFVVIFFLAAIFTLVLENLPRILTFINSSM
ncbi:uncharacterized protein LOC131148582 [Malania oleifera]|uniref:uncharacterized protein LOC131148582 n=1 Tax=Malania oleifera TaxID=397392 RepID=UPI0025ADB276|nr:uncharacterized protein LOC131148582 [Malania oleifera]